MIAWLIYRQKDAKENMDYIQWFIREADKQDVELKLVYREQLQLGLTAEHISLSLTDSTLQMPDFVIIRTIEPFLQAYFTQLSIPVFNDTEVASICNHKAYTYMEIQRLGVPVLPTFFLSADALPDSPPLNYPFVVKPATGRGGQNVRMIRDDKAWHHIAAVFQKEDLVLQSIQHVQLGKDVRVFVIGDEIIAAVLRSNTHDFRANFKLGGEATPFVLTPDMEKLIQRLCSRFRFGLVGIDFLLTESGSLIFNEIEDVVGSRILSETTRINLLEKYMRFIITNVKKHESSSLKR